MALEDVLGWLQRVFAGRLAIPACGEGCFSDEMFAGMYTTAVEMVAEQQAEERAAGFIGASTFEGSKEGFVFTHGPHGLGYSPDQSRGTGDDGAGGEA